MSKRAIITGITGQDGSYLAERLLDKGYEVVGVVRRASAPNYWRIEHLLPRLQLRPGDLLGDSFQPRVAAPPARETAFTHAGLDYERHVKLDPAFLRPAEVD